MFGLKNRGNLESTTLDEFEHLFARLREFLLREHNEDGTHFTEETGLDFVPVGSIVAWGSNTIPVGWLPCHGQSINRLRYKNLFLVIGTTYGTDSLLTFKLPDLRARFIQGLLTGSVGNTGGTTTHTHLVSGTSANESAHTHVIAASGTHTHTGPSHTHSISTSSDGSHDHGGSTGSAGSHSHEVVGNTGAPSNLQEVQSGTGISVGSSSHLHDVDITSDTQSSHAHSISSAGSHSHTGTTGSEGTGNTSASGDHAHGGATATGSAHNHSISFTSGSADHTPPNMKLYYIISTGVE